MRILKQLFLFQLIVFFLASCSTSNKVVTGNFVQKRKYNKGFFVDIKEKPGKVQKYEKSAVLINEQTSYESGQNETDILPLQTISLPEDQSEDAVFATNDESAVSFHEMRSNPIRKVISSEHEEYITSTISEMEPSSDQSDHQLFNDSDRTDQENASGTQKESNKNPTVTWILWALGIFGLFGIHRFYLGYIGIGLIQLFTAGGCGLWWLIDMIMMITGDLKPKERGY